MEIEESCSNRRAAKKEGNILQKTARKFKVSDLTSSSLPLLLFLYATSLFRVCTHKRKERRLIAAGFAKSHKGTKVVSMPRIGLAREEGFSQGHDDASSQDPLQRRKANFNIQ